MKDSSAHLRDQMVKNQLQRRGITNKLVLSAMKKVPRHKFVPSNFMDSAYEDCALPIGEGQTISQPYMVALMTEKLKLIGGEQVLEIGTGSGYQTAILAEIAGHVYTIERITPLAEKAKETLKELKYKNIHVFSGDGTLGLKEKGPFDAIIVTAGAQSIPNPLIEQLNNEGRLVIPVGDVHSQILTTIIKKDNAFTQESSTGCIFVPLVGEHGWKKQDQ